MDGYICLYRKMLGWEWMREPLTAHLFTCLLLLANQDEGWEYMGRQLHAGQLITSLDKLVQWSGLTKREVRTRLERLQRGGEVVVESSNQCTLITLTNYTLYQYCQNTNGTQNGTQNGTRFATQNDTQKTAASSSKTKSSKRTNVQSDTQNGTQNGTRLGTQIATRAENPENQQNQAETMGTQIATQNGTRKSSATNGETAVYDECIEEMGTQNGTQNGTIQYIENNNNIIINNNQDITEKKQTKKECEAFSVKELEEMFEAFRKAYKGTKRGFKPEFENFKRKHQGDWKEIVPLLMPALERMEAWRQEQQAKGQFLPQYAMLQTWLNQNRWTTEYETINTDSNGTTEIGRGTATDTQYVPNYEEEF